MITILKVDGEIINNDCQPFKNIPLVGSKIIYKTFRSNKNWDNPVFDLEIKVVDIIYEYEESWNGFYEEKIIINATLIDKKLISKNEI